MPAEHILVRGVNWLGDAVMATPALLRLREAKPSATITLLSPGKLADLWLGHPAVDEVVAWGKGEGAWAVARRLRAGRFDQAVVFPNSFRSALEVWLAGIPIRLGYRGNGRSFLLTRRVPRRADEIRMRKRSPSEIHRLAAGPAQPAANIPPGAHHIHQYLRLTAEWGASPEPTPPLLVATPEEKGRFAARFGLAPGVGQPVVGLNAGAEYGPAKRWPLERFAEVVGKLDPSHRPAWVIFGGGADRELAARLAALIQTATPASREGRLANVAGETNLRELCAGLASCDALLTNDTGPMHVAAALGVPVVVPFGSTSPELTGPGLPGDPQHALLRHPTPCAPCFLRACPIDFRCMGALDSDMAASALRSRLPGPPPR
jgi:heptosyltransferase-2